MHFVLGSTLLNDSFFLLYTHTFAKMEVAGFSRARCGRNDGQQQQSEVFFHTVRCFHQFMFSSTTDTEKVPFRRVEPPPPVVIVLFAVMRTLAETR